MMKCYKCGNAVSEAIGFNDYCSSCNFDLHCCKMCSFYDPQYNNECRESQADRVVDKEKRNHCDFFKPNNQIISQNTSRDALLSAADALFKKKS